ncbi:DUF2158 domain-containing protein [Ensifer sp. 1H6]|uniref:YodC family protein n=1 Tax=Ensifer sp. 1H6 TaxID=1911585 RepID=UPI000A027540|nr:DUF2158 domain-containing protein [Ensifer sp. 1H6]
MEFKPGDTVELISGGPTMTISSKQNDGGWWCHWFNHQAGNWELKGHSFKTETLKKV